MAFFGRDRREAQVEAPKSLAGSLWETVKTVLWALLIAGLFRTLLFQPFWIPSGSMKDTLLIGDFLFVNKMAYGYSYASCPSIPFVGIQADDVCGWARGDGDDRLWGGAPERGDVVVFRHPVTGMDFIKRLIGLPGDRIQMVEGVLHINGAPVGTEPADEFVEEFRPQGPQGSLPSCRRGEQPAAGGPCVSDRFLETLPNGVTHSVLDIGMTPQDNRGVFTVPEGHLFFMGDNRDNSTDSRFAQADGGVGFVPIEDVVGRADRIMFSSAGRSMLAVWTWRADRFFRAIR
jgi:signal peptidase I